MNAMPKQAFEPEFELRVSSRVIEISMPVSGGALAAAFHIGAGGQVLGFACDARALERLPFDERAEITLMKARADGGQWLLRRLVQNDATPFGTIASGLVQRAALITAEAL